MGYKLIYFDVKGKAEAIRLLLHAANQKFEDVRIPFDEWPAMKHTMPTGMLPVLEIDGKKLPESLAILRYLARKYHMEGQDELEVAAADAMSEVINDFTAHFRPLYHEKDEGIKNKHLEKFKAEAVPCLFKSLVALKDMYGKGDHLVGESLTYVDILYTAVMEGVKLLAHYEPEQPSELSGIHKSVESNHGIAEYLKTCCH